MSYFEERQIMEKLVVLGVSEMIYSRLLSDDLQVCPSASTSSRSI